MNKKDKQIEAVAKIISDHRYIGTIDSKRKLVNSFCDYFKSQNKNFNSIKFYNACMKGDKGIIPEHTTLNNDLKVWDNTEKTIPNTESPEAISLIQQSINNTKQ